MLRKIRLASTGSSASNLLRLLNGNSSMHESDLSGLFWVGRPKAILPHEEMW